MTAYGVSTTEAAFNPETFMKSASAAQDPRMSRTLALVTSYQNFADIFLVAVKLRLVDKHLATSPIVIQDSTGLDLSEDLIRKVLDGTEMDAVIHIDKDALTHACEGPSESLAGNIRNMVAYSPRRGQIILIKGWDESNRDYITFLMSLMAIRLTNEVVVVAGNGKADANLASRIAEQLPATSDLPTYIGIRHDPVRNRVDTRQLPVGVPAVKTF